MQQSSTPVRRRSVATLVAAAAMLAAFVLPATALASHQAQMAPTVTTVQPGCYAKGVFAQPAPAGQNGHLATGAYAYIVTATYTGVDETTPCPPVATFVNNAAGLNSVSLQWDSVPGATGYHLYRAQIDPQTGQPGTFARVLFQQGTVDTISGNCPRPVSINQNGPPANANNGNGGGSRCDIQDVGFPTGSALAVAPIAGTTQAGAAADLTFTQCVDYGGATRSACPFTPPPSNTPIDDPTDAGAGGNALKTDTFHFPPGLNARPGATSTTCNLYGQNSLLGSADLRGSQDPNEDTCPRASLVGYATSLSRTGNSTSTYSLTRGDIYLASQRENGEAARLYIVLRPNCSAGAPSPFNPGGPVCTQAFGGQQAGGNFAEVEKEFLAASSTFVRRSDGTYGIDVNTIEAATGGPLPNTLAVMAPTGPGGSFQTVQPLPVQVHQLSQTLFGTVDQNTQDTSDDRPFLTLPTSCGDHALTADKTTYADPTVSSASTNVPTSNCQALPFSPQLTAVASGDTAAGGHPTLDVTVTQDASEAPSKSVKVTLPASLGTNLAALGNTCTEAELNADTCTKVIGTASATSPLSGDLAGNVYLQSNPGGLPKLVVKLKGLINIDLIGDIDLAGGNRIVNLFPSIPDVPLTRFFLRVNGGENGLLTNLSNLCDGIGNADGEFTAHSGKTATSSAPVQLAATCVRTGNNVGLSKRAKVRIVLAKTKSGKPTLSVVVVRGSTALASNIKTVRMSLPKGLKIIRNDKLEDLLAVKAQNDLLPLTQLVVRTRLLTVDKIAGGPVPKLTEKFRRKSLRSYGSLKRLGKKARPVFRLKVTTYANKSYSYKVKVKPRS